MRWLVLVAFIAACGGGTRYTIDDRLKAEDRITTLWSQIRDFRRDAKMSLDPPRSFIFQFQGHSVQEAAHVCKAGEASPPRCDDACSIADNICDNAETICTLADELGKDDEYAQGKCASAKASCREAKQRCCNCSESPPPEGT
jgi:hypothetical protein